MRDFEAVREGESAREPLSPELALVDPALAARARAALGEPGEAHRSRLQLTRNGPEHVEELQKPSPAEDRVRSRRRFATVVALLIAPVLVGAGVAAAMWVEEDGAVSASAPQAPPVSGSSTPRGSVSKPRPRTNPPAQKAPRSQAARPARKRPSPRRTTSRPRTFAWPQVQGAKHYRVELFQRGVKIFDAKIAAPRLILPARWTHAGRRFRLEQGRYWWRVRPVFRQGSALRYGSPVVAAWLLVSPNGR